MTTFGKIMKKLTLLLAALLCLAGYSQAQTFYVPLYYNGHTYIPVPADTLDNQREVAESLGGHLVYVNDTNERNFLHSNIVCKNPNSSLFTGYWITGEVGVNGSWIDDNGDANFWMNWTARINYWNYLQTVTFPRSEGSFVCLFKQATFYRSRIYTTRFIQFELNFATQPFNAIVEIE